jgi:hypothetical protein
VTKHVAHYLTETTQEKEGSVTPMKHGDEVPVIDVSISVIEALNSWVNQVGLSFKDARAIDRKCANALWGTCTFKIDALPSIGNQQAVPQTVAPAKR